MAGTLSIFRWPDGTELVAEIQPGGDIVDHLHDLTHELLARAMGLPRSAVLAVQCGLEGPGQMALAREEAAVLAIQALLRERLSPAVLARVPGAGAGPGEVPGGDVDVDPEIER